MIENNINNKRGNYILFNNFRNVFIIDYMNN